MWISDNKTATNTDALRCRGGRPSAGAVAFIRVARHDVPFNTGHHQYYYGNRASPRDDSTVAARLSRHPSPSIAGALSKYWRRSDRTVHCASPPPSVSSLGLTSSKGGTHRNFPRTFLRETGCSLHDRGFSWSAVCGLPVSPTALRRRGQRDPSFFFTPRELLMPARFVDARASLQHWQLTRHTVVHSQ